uniref:hypothetical protein n=1 Tax=Serratia marcescens TaxID=615 RepID=UPI00201B5A2C
ADAKAIFLAHTHVYAAGELPAPEYQEAITAIYLSIAGYYIDANALDTYSKQLAAGRSESDILAMFAKQPAFANTASVAFSASLPCSLSSLHSPKPSHIR